ncbi:hypothetical protein DFQ28_011025 [Apophysomyces sp. BC1034]|nr:hypothetical protein DFQ29_009527 [Apophysomyces sp. BC1021]KAG0184511.1 hypothetical protein DFQ28_011025 [Apophysomyces sp. BC1034]
MAHFRYPNASLLNASGRYVHQQQSTDDDEAYETHGEAGTNPPEQQHQRLVRHKLQHKPELKLSPVDVGSVLEKTAIPMADGSDHAHVHWWPTNTVY